MFSRKWRFLLDQNVPEPLGRLLLENDQDVLWSRDAVGADAKDPIVARYAIVENRILISWDRDFGHQRFLSPRYTQLVRIGFSIPEPLAVERFQEIADAVDFFLGRGDRLPVEIKIGKDKVLYRDRHRD